MSTPDGNLNTATATMASAIVSTPCTTTNDHPAAIPLQSTVDDGIGNLVE